MIITAKIEQEILAVECDEVYESVATQILEIISQQAQSGHRIFDGMTIQFGWVRLTLRRCGLQFILYEPDFSHDPTNDLRSNLDCSIEVYLRQQEVIDEISLNTWSPTGCFEEIVAAHGCLAELRLIAKHYADRQGVKGWVIFRAESKEPLTIETLSSQYGKLPVWQLLNARSSLLPYLALPSGYTVILNGDIAEKIFNDQGDLWS